MQKNKSTIFWIGGIFLLLVALFAYPRLRSSTTGSAGGGSEVPCLVPNLPLFRHIHPRVEILVDGRNEGLPANIGMGTCERAIHTHGDAGRGIIHVESQDRREYTLGDFFSVWGKPIEREGYALEATVDGAPLTDPAGLILKDGQEIVIIYKKLESGN